MCMTNDCFKENIHRYMREESINTTGLAKKLGRPVQTVQDWIRKGLSRESARERIIGTYPWLFSKGDEYPHSETELQMGEVETSFHEPVNGSARNFSVVIKTEIAKSYLSSLANILVWFVSQATSKDREIFREELGESWTDFLDLTRAMTGSTAFDVTKTEGRLDKWLRRQ